LPVPFRAIATDLSTRDLVVIGTGDLAQAVRASFAIPLVFAPVRIGDRVLIDGGLALNVPVSVARAMGAERVIVSRMDNSVETPQEIGSTLGTASSLIGFLFLQPPDSLHESDVMIATKVAQYGQLDFAPAQVASLVQEGYDRANAVLRSASCVPAPSPPRRVADLPAIVGEIAPVSESLVDAMAELGELRVRRGAALAIDSLKRGAQRISYSDPFQGVWLNPVSDDSARLGFRPQFIDRPRLSIGVGVDYVTSLGGHLWTGIINRRLAGTRAEGTALLEVSEIRQQVELGARRTSSLLGLTTHPTARVTLAREQVRFYGAGRTQLAPHEVDEARVLLGFERALSWGGRYRWGLESHLWKGRDEPLLNAVGAPLPSHPHPIAAYALATAAYDSLRAHERNDVMADGASMIFVHGARTPRAIVLVHGLTNSPRQFRELAELFYDRGYNVIVPRLPLHGLRTADVASLGALTADAYRDYADGAVDIAGGLGDSVFVMGLSAGGNVASWIAQRRPDVTRVVVIAPAIALGKLPALLDAPAMNLMERVPSITIRQKADTGRRHAYFGVSTRALGETLRFAATVRADAEQDAPAVHDLTMVTNANDRTVDPASALALAALWQSREGVRISYFTFDVALRLPHDLIDASQRCGMPDAVYPVLIALVEKQPVVTPTAASRCDP
ncbi:MAG: alpha/beta fold hydrolase, partial [Gemmatimonadaceae bacterium]